MSDTREFIIDKSYELFLSRSYEAVSISEISKAVGMTKGALYHHFVNKEELFKAVVDKHLDVIEFTFITDVMTVRELILDIQEKAKSSIMNLFGKDENFIPINYLSLIIDAYRHYPSFVDEKQNIFSEQIKNFRRVLENGIKSGEIRKDINTERMAMNLFSVTAGIAANLIYNKSAEKSIKSFNGQLNEYYNLIKA